MEERSTFSSPPDRIGTIISRLEDRLSVVSNAVRHYRSARSLHESEESKTTTSESLFETVVQRIIQGYPVRLTDHLGIEDVQEMIDTTSDAVAEVDHGGVIINVNAAFSDILGFGYTDAVDASFTNFIDDEYRDLFRARLHSIQENGSKAQVSTPRDLLLCRVRHRKEGRVSMECVMSSYASADGALTGVIVMRDLSSHRSLLEQLQQSMDNYDALSETITEAIVRIDESFTIVFANSAVTSTFGYEPQELIGKPFWVLFPPGVFGRHEDEIRKYFYVDDQDRARIGLRNSLEVLGKNKNRGISPMEMSFGNAKDFRGRTLTCIVRDIAQRKNAERRLRHLAFHDQLTGLGNRDLFTADLSDFLKISKRMAVARTGALMFLDLDGFKQVNDTLGHDAGDELLVETARRLHRTLRESDSVYRFGGDEFVVLINLKQDPRDAGLVANKILTAIRRPFILGNGSGHGQAVTVGVSIGIAIVPAHGNSVETLTKAADLAMYSAKEAGKNRFAYYSKSLDRRATQRWQLEQGIRTGLDSGEFRLFYQPLVDADGYIKGVEALLRWNHPVRGNIPPSLFIPPAEETGLIIPLGNWVLETACRDAKRWNESGYPELYVSVNLSPRQFEQKNLVEVIGSIIEATGITPSNLKLEITETCIMSAPESSIEKMLALKERYPGLTIAIDDFGTGYSSLTYLSKLPADIIKIDLSFVSELFSRNNEKIVNAIIGLAHSLQLDIVAEGVESREQWNYFREHNCRTLQGFHFKEAVSSEDITALLPGGSLSPKE